MAAARTRTLLDARAQSGAQTLVRPSGRFRSWPEARAFVHAQGLSSFVAWRQWARSPARPPDIPSNPDQVYAGAGWRDWYDWLGKPRPVRGGRFRPFAAARAYARALGLRDRREWAAWARSGARPPDVPASPDRTYAAAGWQGWHDWLGKPVARTEGGPKPWRPFEAARCYARGLGLPSVRAWRQWAASPARPADIPSNPDRAYAGAAWIDWADWLGTRFASPSGRGRTGAAQLRAGTDGLASAAGLECRAH